MTIKLLKQNLEYFKYPNNVIKSVEIDTRFNDIVNYFNDEIIFKLNNYNNEIIIGSTIQADINSILKSNNDTYFWKKVSNDDFVNNTIDIKKISHKKIKNSFFVTNNNGDLQQIGFNNKNDLALFTILCDNKSIKLGRISNDYIDPYTKITGDKIKEKTIDSYHLSNITPSIGLNSTDGSYIINNSIKTRNIKDGSLKLDRFDNNAREHLERYIWSSIIPNYYINLNSNLNKTYINSIWNRDLLKRMLSSSSPAGRKLSNPYNIPINRFSNFRVKNIIKYYSNNTNIVDLSLTTPNGKKVCIEKRYILSSNLFKPNSINPNRLVYWYAKGNYKHAHNINTIIAPKSITIDHLTTAIANKIRG